MTYEDLEKLSEQYAEALMLEANALKKSAEVSKELEVIKLTVLSGAQEAGIIDGKNAETRKLQTDALLASSHEVVQAQEVSIIVDKLIKSAEIERKRIETLVSLVRAWLYSQAGPK